MTDELGELDFQGALEGFKAPGTPSDVEEKRVKARAVLRALAAGGLKTPYDFDQEDAIPLWAVKLGDYPLDVLLEAAQVWIDAPGTDYPSLGDIETQASYLVKERENRRVVRNGICPECEGDHWVTEVVGVELVETYQSQMKRLKDPLLEPLYVEVPQRYKRPCSTCPEMRRRYELWHAGHFEAAHVAGGGCRECYDYTPLAMSERARKRG